MKIFKVCLFALLFSFSVFGDEQFGGAVSIGKTPSSLDAAVYTASIDTHFVQKVTIRVIPGYCQKIYISVGSAPDKVAYSNVIKVLFPNCTGGLSDEYTLEDRSGNDGIDTRNFHIVADDSTLFLVEFNQSGQLGAVSLKPLYYGAVPLSSYNVNIAYVKAGTNLNSSVGVAQFAIIPGMSSKFWIESPNGAEKVLYPNNGNVTGNITDKWELYGRPNTENSILVAATGFYVQRQPGTETVLYAFWKYM